MTILDIFSGYKSYIGAIGLLGLSLFQLSQGDFATALQSAMAALSVFGLRTAITKNELAMKETLLQLKK